MARRPQPPIYRFNPLEVVQVKSVVRTPGNSIGMAAPVPAEVCPTCLPARPSWPRDAGRTRGTRGTRIPGKPTRPPARPFSACHQVGGTAAEPRPARGWAKPSARPPVGTLEPGRHSRWACGGMPRANASRSLPGLHAPVYSRDALAGGHPRARASLPKSTESAKTLTAGRCPLGECQSKFNRPACPPPLLAETPWQGGTLELGLAAMPRANTSRSVRAGCETPPRAKQGRVYLTWTPAEACHRDPARANMLAPGRILAEVGRRRVVGLALDLPAHPSNIAGFGRDTVTGRGGGCHRQALLKFTQPASPPTCIDFMCQILGLNVVVQTSSSRNLASIMCTDIMVLKTWTQCSSTDL